MKKMLASILAIIMTLSFVPVASALEVHSHEISNKCLTNSGNQQLFEVPLSNDYIDAIDGKFIGGTYYLVEDIVIDNIHEWITICEGETVICLNGYDIISNVSQKGEEVPAIEVFEEGKLTICDCKGDGKIQTAGIGVIVYGCFDMYDIDVVADYRCVHVVDNGEFNMYGGRMRATDYAVVVFGVDGSANLYGGVIGGSKIWSCTDGTIKELGVKICNDLCHVDGYVGFFWLFIAFFCKILGIYPECACGATHY